MATKFTVGNYYENTSREVVILITARTKCFVSYKEFWISDLINNGKSYTEGRVKVKLNDNDEYILVDRFSEYKAANNYVIGEVKEVIKKEHYSAVHRNFLKVNSKYRYVDLKNNIDQDVVFEDANDNGAVLNFKAIDKNGNKFSCEGSLFVVTEYNRDCLKPFTNNVAIAKVTEVKNELTFGEVKTFALNAGYTLTLKDEYFSLCSNSGRIGQFTKLIDVTEVIKEGRLLNGEFISTNNSAIATEEEIKEDMTLTKESDAALKLLVKYDFTMRELTQFEEFSLTSLKKYVEGGEPPKLIKTFAETLLRKLSPEERVDLRDRALTKVIKNKERLDDAKEWFKISDILKKDVEVMGVDEIHIILKFLEENKALDIKSVPHSRGGSIYRYDLTCYNWHEVLKDEGFLLESLYFKAKYGTDHEVFNDIQKKKLVRLIRGSLSEKVFLNLCFHEGLDNDHEASLKWIEFINKTVGCEVPEKWEESWEEFKESEEFEKLI